MEIGDYYYKTIAVIMTKNQEQYSMVVYNHIIH